MGIRFPLKAVLSYVSGEIGTGPASLVGGVAKTFTLPQDTDNVVVRLQASILGGGVSATFQTTPDGGTTWFDVARTSTVSYTGNSVLGGGNTNAEWLSIPVIGAGMANVTTSVVAVGSVQSFGRTTGSAAASTIAINSYNGLPLLGAYNRVFLRYTAAVSSIMNESVTVFANSQSGTR